MTLEQIQYWATQGVGVLFGAVCLWWLLRTEQAHRKELVVLNARLEAMLTRQLDMAEKGIEAMSSLEHTVEGMNELKALSEKIDELRGGRLRRP